VVVFVVVIVGLVVVVAEVVVVGLVVVVAEVVVDVVVKVVVVVGAIVVLVELDSEEVAPEMCTVEEVASCAVAAAVSMATEEVAAIVGESDAAADEVVDSAACKKYNKAIGNLGLRNKNKTVIVEIENDPSTFSCWLEVVPEVRDDDSSSSGGGFSVLRLVVLRAGRFFGRKVALVTFSNFIGDD